MATAIATPAEQSSVTCLGGKHLTFRLASEE
jgi:hypothetical protein